MERSLATTARVLIGLVLLTPLIVMSDPFPGTFFPFIVGKALYARTMIELAFLVWVLLAMRSPAYRLRRTWLVALVGGYILAMGLATLFSVSPQRSLWSTYERMMGLFDTAHWFLLIVMTAALFRSWVHWRVLLSANLAVGTLMALLGLSEWFGFVPVIDALHYLGNPGGATGGRLDITLGNPTYVGAYYLLNSIVALGLLGHSYLRGNQTAEPQAMGRRRRRSVREAPRSNAGQFETWWRVFWAVTAVLGLSMLFLSGTRGALAGLAAGVTSFAFAYLLWGQLRTIRRASVAILATVFLLTLGVGLARGTSAFESLAKHSVMIDRLVQTGASDDSLRGRLDSANLGLRGFVARPLLGWGPENFTVAYDRYLTVEIVGSATVSFDQAHNKLVEELTTKGAIGFLAYMAIWLYMLGAIVRRARAQTPHDQLFTLAVGAALAGYFFQNLFLFDTPGTIVQFILLSAFVTYLDSPPAKAAPETADTQDDQRDEADPLASLPGYSYWRHFLADDREEVARRSDQRRRSSSRNDEMTTGYMVTAGLLVIAMSVFIFLMSARPYDAARSASDALQADVPWREKLALLDDSFATFPPLANHPVLFQNRFGVLSANLNDLQSGEIAPALIAARQAGNAGLDRNPKEWRIMLLLAQLYQTLYPRLTPTDPALIEWSNELVDEAMELAPERIEVQMVNVVQHLVEGDLAGASRAIDEYLERNPAATANFATLKQQIDATMAQ